MASVDDRIVHMEFDNASFERKVADTLGSIASLNKALEFKGAGDGLAGISEKASKFSLAGIASSVENISSKFHTLGAVAFTVIQSITNSALGIAKKLGGDILGPIITGGTKRAKNIEQAQFMFRGLGIDVQKGMDSALKAVKGTAFGLDEAAKAAAQFGASGIQVGDQMTSALRGVAGAAAMTGSSFSEMADIFAGSAGSGVVNNQDLMQFATRGLNAAAAVGKVLGKTEAQIHEMATKGTLDFKTFAGAMDVAFGAHATEANQTFTGALANMHAAMSRLGAALIGPELTNFRDLFNGITPVIDKLTAALDPLFKTIVLITQQEIGGALKFLSKMNFNNLKKAMLPLQIGFLNIFIFLKKIYDIGKLAFRDIFPKSTTSTIVTIATAFQKLTQWLIFSAQTGGKIRRIFDGVFSVFKIGYDIIKGVVTVIAGLVGAFFHLSGGGILEGLAKIGDFFTNLQKGVLSSGNIQKFFDDLIPKIILFGDKIKDVVEKVVAFFKGPAKDSISGPLDTAATAGERIHNVFDRLKDIWHVVKTAFLKISGVLGDVFTTLWDWCKDLGKNLADAFTSDNFKPVLDAVNTGLLGGIIGMLALFFKKGIKIDLTGGFMTKINGIFTQLGSTLKTFQLSIKADALMKIAKAIAILTASVVVLSLIDSEKLTSALWAMAAGFTELMASFAALGKINSDPKSGANLALLATGLLILAGAILVLSVAAKIFSTMDWEGLARGLTGVTVVLGEMVLVSKLVDAKGMITAGLGILVIAGSLLILGAAVRLFSGMSLGDLGVGMASVATGLAVIAGAMRLMPKNMGVQGAGLALVAVGILVLANAVKIFAGL